MSLRRASTATAAASCSTVIDGDGASGRPGGTLHPAIAKAVGLEGADAGTVFAELRERKNNF